MKPEGATVHGHHCGKECPYLKIYRHPFFARTAWCSHQLRELSWHDYWQADCLDRTPDETLLRAAGRAPLAGRQAGT